MKAIPITGHTRIFGLIGHPVRHSLSPAMYNTLFARFEIDAVYLAFDVDPKNAQKVADLIRVMGLDGVNLTVPFKEAVMPLLNTTTTAAAEAGAVNVVIQTDGELVGFNTDGEGFIRALSEEAGPQIEGIHAIILGAGGAARAVASGLLDRKAARISILNRSQARAKQAASALKASFPDGRIDVGPLDAKAFGLIAGSAALVVNCTAGPAAPTIGTFEPKRLGGPQATWVDINYWMEVPPAQTRCEDAGVRFYDGLGMLAHQGALAFELFTGHPITGAELLTFLRGQK
jgi:shikimate dehydrogenase